MSKARDLADSVAAGSVLADGVVSLSEVGGGTNNGVVYVNGTGTTTSGSTLTFDGANLGVAGTVDGRDVAADGSKLDGIEAGADVTDTANVTAAGAVMDSELTNITAVKALDQGVATTDEPSWDGVNLNAISATLSDTAVDVFVYDTSKDSDGGAWRKRTQHTSWYNETLNTATRGSRREFPAVAVIVATATTVTIYDGDDPAMPMWMVFTKSSDGSVHWLGGDSLAPNSSDTIFALNGIIASGVTSTSAGRLVWANFVSDEGYNMVHVGKYKFNGGIGTRNDGLSWYQVTSTLALVNRSVNDVAMTVLPNAPIDAATGLPTPTIAVATNGGVSVIKDDGTVVSLATQQNLANTVTWLNNKYLAADTSGYAYVFSLASLPKTVSGYVSGETPSSDLWHHYSFNSSSNTYNYSLVGTNGTFKVGHAGKYVGNFNDKGLTLIEENFSNYQKGSVAYITSKYNTGWMPGDIKGAWLSDTTQETVVGTELVTNGTFDSSLSGWTTTAGSASQSSGQASITGASGDTSGIYQIISGLQIGATYILSANLISSSGGNRYLGISSTGNPRDTAYNSIGNASWVVGTTGVVQWTATVSSVAVWIGTYNLQTIVVDNVSFKRADADRSVNNNGLQVFGNITKTPVATGADLVAYSGFSTSNYLLQPYNSGLDFGTGDFYVSCWVKSDPNQSYSETRYFFERSSISDPTNTRIEAGFSGAGTINVWVQGGSQIGSFSVAPDSWVKFELLRRSGMVFIYINGVLRGSAFKPYSIVDTSARLVIGARAYFQPIAQPMAGSIALFRMSATAPSPEQIAKMYEDEKVLFQAGAQATLYGSSDAVTALAYDDSTNLLHVGTSAGRSVFNGLRRVDNTTSAVGAAISASNGMVAED